LGLCGGGLTL